MTAKELASLLDDREYGSEITKEEIAAAKAAGLVVVFGASDDLIEFRGAIDDEGGCFDGRTVYFDLDGISQDGAEKAHSIEAVWCGVENYAWAYRTSIPHEEFDIWEDVERYCRGIVFSVEDMKPKEKCSAEEKERYFNILRGIVMGAFLSYTEKQEIIEFINDTEEGCINEK